MARIEITHETTWSAECTVGDDGDVMLTAVNCEGEPLPWKYLPLTVDTLLCAAARAAEDEQMRAAAGAEVDARILERKEGER